MNTFLKGCLAATLSGLGGGLILFVGDPSHFSLSHAKEILWPCIGWGLAGLALYLKESPLKDIENEALKETLQRYKNRD